MIIYKRKLNLKILKLKNKRRQIMKKFIRLLILVVSFGTTVFYFSGCRSSKEVSKTPEPPLQQVQKTDPIPWTQDLDEGIAVGDPINFYNQFQINVKGSIPIRIKMYNDGKLQFKDSSIVFDYTIPALTKCELKDVSPKNGKPTSFTVSFEQNGDEDKNYYHVFKMLPDKTFVLDSKMTLSLEGGEYPFTATINGDGSGKNRLLFYPEFTNSERTVGKPASGVPDAIGTKVIKK